MAVCFSAVSSSKPWHSQLQGQPVPLGGPTAMPGRLLRDEGRVMVQKTQPRQCLIPHRLCLKHTADWWRGSRRGWRTSLLLAAGGGQGPVQARWAGVRCTRSHPESLGVQGLLPGVEDRGVVGDVGILEPRTSGSKTEGPMAAFRMWSSGPGDEEGWREDRRKNRCWCSGAVQVGRKVWPLHPNRRSVSGSQGDLSQLCAP